MMKLKMKHTLAAIAFAIALAIPTSAQTAGKTQEQRAPSKATRPFIVEKAQSLADLERKLHSDNTTEDLIGGAGMQLRVAVQHEKDKVAALGELHDASDDVYYVLEGSATLTLGGKLETPNEIEPGEWRGPRILGGQQVEIAKGDLIIVPRGTPHMRSTVGKDFSMILIKVFAQALPAPQPKPAPVVKVQKP